jgi:isopropylmalate/homocitrate/citramalate synthase
LNPNSNRYNSKYSPKENQKVYQDLESQTTKVAAAKSELQSRCTHRKANGEAAYRKYRITNNQELAKKIGSDLAFRCEICGDIFSLEAVSDKEFEKAFQVMTRVINANKIAIGLPKTESGAAELEKIVKLCHRLKSAPRYYHFIKNSRKKKNKQQENTRWE